MVSDVRDGGVCVGGVESSIMSPHLSCSRLNQGLLAVVASVGNVIMAPLDPRPHNAHLVRHTMQGEAGLNPAPA